MKGIIMAGGFGTRLRPLTYGVPKPMVPILNKPIMEYVIKLLKKEGITDIVSLLYFEPEVIKDYFETGEKVGVKMRYAIPTADLGTSGAVKFAITTYNINEPVLVISGDLLTDFSLRGALEFHRSKGSLATILLTRVENPLAFGIVITNNEGKIERFLEKPSWGQVFSDTVNTGIYILEPEVYDLIPPNEEFDFSRDLFPLMLKEGKPLYGYIANGYWRDIGSLRDYKEACFDALYDRVRIEKSGRKIEWHGCELWAEEPPEIPNGVELSGRIYLGKGVKLSPGARLKDSIIGDNSSIGVGSSCVSSIIWDNVSLGDFSDIRESIIVSGVRVGERAIVMENAIISFGSKIGDEAIINPGVKIWPNKEVEDRAVLSSSLIWGDRWAGEMFTRSRISGIINDEISPEFASKLGGVLGSHIGAGNEVVVSRDSDRSSQMIARALISGLLSAGSRVQYFGILPIPVIRACLRERPSYRAGVHIRKSPYDARVIDLIFFSSGGKDMPAGTCRSIERVFFREDFPRASYNKIGTLERPRGILEAYKTAFLNSIDVEPIRAKKFKLVVDFSFGGAIEALHDILDELGSEIIPLNAYIDPNRITKTRSELERQLADLSIIVNSLGADIGFMIDPSGERLYIIDENGRLLNADEELYAVTKLFLMVTGAKSIAVPISATMAIDKLASEYNVRLTRTRDDHLSLMEAASSPEIDFVAGTRGGFIFKPFSFACDAMFAMVKILELLAKAGIRFSQLLEGFPSLYREERVVMCSWKSKGKIMRELISETSGLKRDIIDGVRILFEDGWVLVLPDSAHPQFTVMCESVSEEEAAKLADQYAEMLRRWQKE